MNPIILSLFGSSRAIVGAISWLAPTLGLSLFVTPKPEANTSTILVTRLFGVRDFVLGASLLYVTNPEVLRYVIQMGVVVDTLDVIGSLLIYKDMHIRAKLSLTAGAAIFSVLGLYLLNA